MIRLKEYRHDHGLTQADVVEKILARARERGDPVTPGLDPTAVSRHENEHKRPGPYYRALYCDIYGATPAELGFCVALPGEERDDEAVNRREFLAGAAGFAATAAVPSVVSARKVGHGDVVHLQQSMTHLYTMDNQLGGGTVQASTVRLFHRIRGLAEHASYSQATGRELQELTSLTAEHAGWLAFDDDRQDDARRWWLEAMQWSRLAGADSAGVVTMASMARQASDQHRPREAIDLAASGQSTAATPRLSSVLLGREALGHAGVGDANSARAALRRARGAAAQAPHDDDPAWLAFYGPADFAAHERRVALLLGDYVAAEEAARSALALNDPVVYSRNRVLYLIGLADVLVLRREPEESAAVATQAGAAAALLDSKRVTQRLRLTAQSLAPFKHEPGVEQFVERYAGAVQ